MTEDMKKESYLMYISEILYEWGSTDGAMSYVEYCKYCEEHDCWDIDGIG